MPELSAKARDVLEESKDWINSQFADRTEKDGRWRRVEQILKDDPDATEIMEELRPLSLRWRSFAGD